MKIFGVDFPWRQDPNEAQRIRHVVDARRQEQEQEAERKKDRDAWIVDMLRTMPAGMLASDAFSLPDDSDIPAAMARRYERRAGVGANWPYLSNITRAGKIRAMREALAYLGSLQEIPGVPAEDMDVLRDVLSAILKGPDNVTN